MTGASVGQRILWLLLGCCCISLASCHDDHSEAHNRVLLVHSYDDSYAWVQAITQGVQEGLAGAGVDLKVFYMDTKRNPGQAWCEEAGRQASERVTKFDPDVVIAADDNAQECFAKQYVGMARPQIVFCGVNGDPSAYGYAAANVTGVRERTYLGESVALLREIRPEVRKIVLITDASVTSDLMVEDMKAQDVAGEILSFDQTNALEEWRSLVTGYEDTVDAMVIGLYHTIFEGSGDQLQHVDPQEVLDWTLAATSKPTAAVFEFGVSGGALCGVVVDGVEHGREAAQLTRAILDGARAGDLPIITTEGRRIVVNAATASKLGFEIPATVLEEADEVYGE
jgi:ABC-type uncharacterized transport system substrate-binding protein